mgnify:CR=1 FL=1
MSNLITFEESELVRKNFFLETKKHWNSLIPFRMRNFKTNEWNIVVEVCFYRNEDKSLQEVPFIGIYITKFNSHDSLFKQSTMLPTYNLTESGIKATVIYLIKLTLENWKAVAQKYAELEYMDLGVDPQRKKFFLEKFNPVLSEVTSFQVELEERMRSYVMRGKVKQKNYLKSVSGKG